MGQHAKSSDDSASAPVNLVKNGTGPPEDDQVVVPLARSRRPRLAERYRLEREIGAGRLTTAWRAVDELRGRQVVVKVFRDPTLHDAAFRERLRSEIRAASGLSHPGIAVVHDAGAAAAPGGSRAYVVMEALDGETLAARLERGRLDWREAARTGAAVASALAYAHAAGQAHYHLTPREIFLSTAGVKVLDFGIAKAVHGADDPMSPSSIRQFEDDVQALGRVLLHALTGDPADERSAPNREPRFPEGMPPAFASLCASCLASDPAQRPTAAEICEDLSRLAESEAEEAAPEGPQAPEGPETADGAEAAKGGEPVKAARSARRRRVRLLWQVSGVLVSTGAAATTLQFAINDALISQDRSIQRPVPPAAPTAATPATPPGAPSQMSTSSEAINPAPPPQEPSSPPAAPPAPSPTQTATPESNEPAVVPPVSFREGLGRLRFSVGRGVAKGEIRQDVGLDLDNVIRGMLAESGSGDTGRDRENAARLREKIATRWREGAISGPRVEKLLSILRQTGL